MRVLVAVDLELGLMRFHFERGSSLAKVQAGANLLPLVLRLPLKEVEFLL